MDSRIEALQRAVDCMGGQVALASAIGVSQQHVWNWLNRKGTSGAPAQYCPDIERVTRDKGTPVWCEDLRSDVKWSVLRTERRDSPPSGGRRGKSKQSLAKSA
jgi:DNA-binding transcriptional regulator YdaS (Cro superfamily)